MTASSPFLMRLLDPPPTPARPAPNPVPTPAAPPRPLSEQAREALCARGIRPNAGGRPPKRIRTPEQALRYAAAGNLDPLWPGSRDWLISMVVDAIAATPPASDEPR